MSDEHDDTPRCPDVAAGAGPGALARDEEEARVFASGSRPIVIDGDEPIAATAADPQPSPSPSRHWRPMPMTDPPWRGPRGRVWSQSPISTGRRALEQERSGPRLDRIGLPCPCKVDHRPSRRQSRSRATASTARSTAPEELQPMVNPQYAHTPLSPRGSRRRTLPQVSCPEA